MDKTLKLKCSNCGTEYAKPESYKVLSKNRSNVFFKWSLLYCDKCRREKEKEALKSLPEIINILSR